MKFKSQLAVMGIAVIAFLAAFTGVALAADALDPPGGDGNLPQLLYQAFTGGHYAYAASLALVVVVAAARKWISPSWKPLNTEGGNAVLVMLGSFGASMSAALAGGGSVTGAMAEGAFETSLAAVGGFTAVDKLLVGPYLRPLAAKAPKWLQPAFSAVLWIFDHEAAQQPPANPVPSLSVPVVNPPTTGGSK